MGESEVLLLASLLIYDWWIYPTWRRVCHVVSYSMLKSYVTFLCCNISNNFEYESSRKF